jgi:hypothetical protein
VLSYPGKSFLVPYLGSPAIVTLHKNVSLNCQREPDVKCGFDDVTGVRCTVGLIPRHMLDPNGKQTSHCRSIKPEQQLYTSRRAAHPPYSRLVAADS